MKWYVTAWLCSGMICYMFSFHRLVHNKLTRCCTIIDRPRPYFLTLNHFLNVFKFHACFVNKRLFLTIKVNYETSILSFADLRALSEGKSISLDESIRRVERGSRIVTAIASDTRLVLQMPRGNLETIHPRALVIAAIRKSLDALQYSAAFSIMRRHRIDMNLIVDHNPQVRVEMIYGSLLALTGLWKWQWTVGGKEAQFLRKWWFIAPEIGLWSISESHTHPHTPYWYKKKNFPKKKKVKYLKFIMMII